MIGTVPKVRRGGAANSTRHHGSNRLSMLFCAPGSNQNISYKKAIKPSHNTKTPQKPPTFAPIDHYTARVRASLEQPPPARPDAEPLDAALLLLVPRIVQPHAAALVRELVPPQCLP